MNRWLKMKFRCCESHLVISIYTFLGIGYSSSLYNVSTLWAKRDTGFWSCKKVVPIVSFCKKKLSERFFLNLDYCNDNMDLVLKASPDTLHSFEITFITVIMYCTIFSLLSKQYVIQYHLCLWYIAKINIVFLVCINFENFVAFR